MEHTAISPRKSINVNRLDRQNYTLALLKEGYRVGLLTVEAVNGCQNQIMELLKELILRFTGGASSSVRLQQAQSFLLSILYTVDACLLELDDPNEAADLINKASMRDLYNRGAAILHAHYESSRSLFYRAQKHQLEVNNLAYQSTLNQALPDFFNHYDIAYYAHDNTADIDYPLVFDDMDLQGIYYIKHYLEVLELETTFCRYYSTAKLNQLLSAYGRVYRLNPSQALLNIFEIVLNNAIFSVLADQSGRDLSFSGIQLKSLHVRLSSCSGDELSLMIGNAIDMIIAELPVQNPNLRLYMHNYSGTLLPRLSSALQYGHLDNMVIVDDQFEAAAEVFFDSGQSMSDADFRSMVDKIMHCKTSRQRIDLVIGSLHSLNDFVDLLESDCLFDEDWPVLFGSLGDMEMSVLARIVYLEQIRSDPMGFALSHASLESLDKPWQVEYTQFLKGLDQKRRNSIDQYLRLSIH